MPGMSEHNDRKHLNPGGTRGGVSTPARGKGSQEQIYCKYTLYITMDGGPLVVAWWATNIAYITTTSVYPNYFV